ncbi:MAG: hypothetical protein QXF56_00380 [Candidatus Micrarchaeia archaeon]
MEKLKLNLINNPEELVEIAISHKNPEVCKAAIDRIKKLDLVDERKAALICTVAKETPHESVCRHAFGFCSESKLPDEVKLRMLKGAIEKIKFDSVKKEMERWLKEHK